MCHDSALLEILLLLYPDWYRGLEAAVSRTSLSSCLSSVIPAFIPTNERRHLKQTLGEAITCLSQKRRPLYIISILPFRALLSFTSLSVIPSFRYPHLVCLLPGQSLAARERSETGGHHGSGIQYLPQFQQDLWVQSMQDTSCGL